MIDKCCICGKSVKTRFTLGFEDLIGADGKLYSQHVALCENCGYIFTQNPFTPEQLENRYKNLSKFEYDSKDYVLDNSFKAQSVRQKHFIEENADLSEIKSMVEVGAASGYNLSIYKGQIDRVYGIEPSEINCTLSKENYGVDMFNGMFDEYITSGNAEKFDLVFLSMVLEHIVNPSDFIRKIKGISNNYIFIEVPVLDMRHREEPMGIFCEEHVSIFTADSLNELMNKEGFELVNAEIVFGLGKYLPAGYPSIMSLWKKGEAQKNTFKINMTSAESLLDGYINDSLSGLKRIKEKIDAIPDGMRLAVWGIGHHSAMLLANTSLKNKNIVRVYDADKRKHTYTFNGVKIESFNMKDIESGEVEGILLTTYTAQKAIMRFIEKQNPDCKIYTLYDI